VISSSLSSSDSALSGLCRTRASPVDERLNEGWVGGGGGGARVCTGAAAVVGGIEPGIGGTRLARLLLTPGVVGEVWIGSPGPKYDVLLVGGDRGDPGASGALDGTAGTATVRDGTLAVGV
jgi:hypothetical protein